MLLPHDRVGSDFSWLQVRSQEDSAVLKAHELEDEESFLYGNEDTGGKQAKKSSTALFASFPQIGKHAKLQEVASSGSQHHQSKSIFSSFGDLFDLKQPLQMNSSADLDSSECEKIRNILKSLGTADVSDIMVKMQGQREGKQPSPAVPASDQTAAGLVLPALRNPNVRHALESLQSLIKATKEKREKSDGNGTFQTSADKNKAGDDEEGKTEKQARISKMESLMKELDGLLKQDGFSFLSPVIGFYCQKCEEFIGDLNSAENHAAIHSHSTSSSKVQKDKPAGDSKGHSRHFINSTQHPHPSDRDHRDYGHRRDHRNHRDQQRDWRDERDHRSKHQDDCRSHRVGQDNVSMKEEMRKERMLITVSRGLTPPPNVRVKEEVNKEQTVGCHSKVKVEDEAGKEKASKSNRATDESSDSSDDNKRKTQKAKSPKKKKKEKKKKKKKKGSPNC
ncbi:uncharacterized protein LOC116378133 isoform X2 [Anarrhichthys ocellatus]|uniref:uncharacterized protein LOC116378133 isoform X2 n=1 Tax=Anarrhichthys ocellatus TaxID=433405 RepID=UPI0012EED87D|nr:uncharacterized protein LOC116378133 isoform X2 [Anarrhichthys ocellatus]